MRSLPSSPRGASLVITLVFILLLSVLMVLFFVQASSYRMLSNSGVNDFKSETLARSALNVVVGDLLQEIVDGSTTATVGTSTNATIYTPTANTYVIPLRSGNPAVVAGVDPVPNLVRRSVRADALASPGVKSFASAVNSTTDPAINGQFVSLARWNNHYLIPRSSSYGGATSTNAGTDPVSTFVAPDWVYVTSKGPSVLTSADSSTIGRYAYAIYDEGGLLDMNVAGYPSTTPVEQNPHPASGVANLPAWVTNSPDWGSGNRGSLAFANLQALALNGQQILTAKQVDLLVGFRNAASAQPSGTLASGYTFPLAAALRYHDFVLGNTNGFLGVSTNLWTSATGTRTDQAFSSRQALIKFFISSGLPPAALQYLGTFSRDVEQPTFTPAVGRPTVQNGINAAANIGYFGTGNDAYAGDRTGTPATDINPPLLGVRVTTTFNRPDGTKTQVGEPLLKKRFPLSRLNLILSSAIATKSDSDPIYRNFGLYRSAITDAWKYDHGAGGTKIYRLSDVAAAGREPDFFELLKAAINTGSLAKGIGYNAVSDTASWTEPGASAYLQQIRDNSTNLQILQIGANIIDQAKTDNFPTRIQFAGDATVPPFEVRGVEDLPYLYRLRNWLVCTDSTSTTKGGVVMLLPELWNPHAYSANNAAFAPAGKTPVNFRVRLTPDPTASNPVVVVSANYQNSAKPAATDTLSSSDVTAPGGTPLVTAIGPTTLPDPVSFTAGEANSAWGFREPTLLGLANTPKGVGVTGTTSASDPNHVQSSYTNVNAAGGETIAGLVLGQFPWIDSTLNVGVYKFNVLIPSVKTTNSSLHLYLEYKDANGNWITYDDAPLEYSDNQSTQDVHTFWNYPSFAKAAAGLGLYGFVRTDPRSSRWGFHYTELLNNRTVTSTASVFNTERAAAGVSYATHFGSPIDTGLHGTSAANAAGNGKETKGFQSGYWAENSVRKTAGQTGADDGLRYVCDPDGVVRRTIGGYATDPVNGGDASASSSTVGLPLATGNYDSRPTLLHRPFRSVAELGYAFRDTPWGNINFSFPESGDSALLDVFCINETSDPNGVVAGRVSLNTRQAPVLQAILAGTLLNKDDAANPVYTATMAANLAAQFVARTSNPGGTAGYGPVSNRADLVGTWIFGSSPTTAATSLKVAPDSTTYYSKYYSGFSYDIGTVTGVKGTAAALIPRQREAAIRALSDAGTSRTWNLLIDLIAQSGRFPSTATSPANFQVEGEKHYWLHVSLDRYTGKIIDSQLEAAKE